MQCVACKTELEPDSANPDTDYQFDNALWIKFEGGYGMFIDEMSEEMQHAPRRNEEVEPGVFWNVIPVHDEWTEEEIEHYKSETWKINRAVLCHECAHHLCETVPWIADLLTPHNSHSHRSDYRQANPNHFGWDYDMYDEEGNRREV